MRTLHRPVHFSMPNDFLRLARLHSPSLPEPPLSEMRSDWLPGLGQFPPIQSGDHESLSIIGRFVPGNTGIIVPSRSFRVPSGHALEATGAAVVQSCWTNSKETL
jgi:hypothetical protein